MTDFTQAFQNYHKNKLDAMNEISLLLVKLSCLIAQSHITFSMCMEEFIRLMCFHRSLCKFFLIG